MSTTLLDYLPDPNEVDPAAVIVVRQRLQTFINQFWPELDTRPNSVFGDLHLTPLALLVSSIEIAKTRLFNDLDLAKVAAGRISNPDFVAAYLQGLGVVFREPVAATGMIRLTFSADINYNFDLDATFTFGAQVFKINPVVGNPVVVSGTNKQAARYTLTPIASNQYVVFLPVGGPPGSIVVDGDIASTNLTASELVSVTAAGNFDSGLMPESLSRLALKAQRNFASANLTSRTGVISFLNLRFPNLQGASATINGDSEMIRPGPTPLGMVEGSVDAFIKSKPNFTSDQVIATLVYNFNLQAWVGQIPFSTVPAFMDLKQGIFQVGNFLNLRGLNTIYSRSSHPYIDNIGIAYSRYETLGIQIRDTNPTNVQPSSLSGAKALVSDGTSLQIHGEYQSDVFNVKAGRNITLRLDTVTTLDGLPAMQANVRDTLSGEVGKVFFIPNKAILPDTAIIKQGAGDYRRMLNGFDMKLVPPSGTLDFSTMLGFVYQFSFQGRSANFAVNFLYDPAVSLVDTIIQDPSNKPVNVSVLARSFLVCHISDFVINYRIPYGIQFDQESVRQTVSDYVNSIVFPDVYEESRIGSILALLGGGSVLSVGKRGVFYPSIGSIYIDRNGVQIPVPRISTTTLLPPVNSAGVGSRNVTYLLDPTNISFNATIR